MRRVCAWCRTDLDGLPTEPEPSQPVTHGICERCVLEVFAGTQEPLEHFLDELPAPVLLVDAEGVVRTANRQACQLLGRAREQFPGHRGGEVLNCVRAARPGGCGRQVHCQSCTIRRTVMRTMQTGVPAVQVPAFADTGDCARPQRVSVAISTERAGETVLLRIDELRPEATPSA